MSGEWVGYFSHRAPASEGGGAAMQFASMQIELSDDGDAILGSGADGLGSFELQRGRRAVDVTPHSVEFSKVYTAVQVARNSVAILAQFCAIILTAHLPHRAGGVRADGRRGRRRGGRSLL